ncbi:MAG TPA: hypothetical protein VEB70_07560 [Noviherbaspirillum sp.]|nr:hypothetical protein [Noviherbaspirillum sp.]
MFRCAKQYRARGASLLELLIAVSLLGALAAVLLTRLAQLEAAAERAYVDYTVSALKSALRLRVAQLMLEGRMQEVVRLAGSNPMDLLEPKPNNYAGTFASGAQAAHSGNWYFALDTGELVYVLKNTRHLGESNPRTVSIRLERVGSAAEMAGAEVRLSAVTNSMTSAKR